MLLDILFWEIYVSDRFCDVLKLKRVPRQKKYQRVLWKLPAIDIYLSTYLSIYFFCVPVERHWFIDPDTYYQEFLAHLDRNSPQKYRYYKPRPKWLSVKNDLSLLSSQN